MYYKHILIIMKSLLCLLIFLQCTVGANSQTTTNDSVYKIAVFAPIFIDSAFNGNNYKVTGNYIPKTMLPGLDFYNGIMMAIDSLQKEKANIEVIFFDSKSSQEPMKKILALKVWDSVSLIISSFKDRADIKPLADFALSKEIPLVSATYPNDGGITENPFFILLNPTLKTHCEGIYKHIQKNYSTGNLVYVKRKGRLEDEIQSIFTEMGKTTPAIPLKYKTIELSDVFTIENLQNVLDSNRQNIVICGSVNESFGIKLVNILQSNKKYSAIAIGMPTWDGLKDLNKPSMDETNKGIEIVYSTPYYFSKNTSLVKHLASKYKETFFARASDWFYKGFETMYYFSNTLTKNKGLIFNHLTDKDFTIFNEFEIEQVLPNKDAVLPNYWENKKLYFFKKQNGITKSVN
jgi:hypothetical protein